MKRLLMLWLLATVVAQIPAIRNIALRKPTSQSLARSLNRIVRNASYAVDGQPTFCFSPLDVTIPFAWTGPNGSSRAWWMVDLGDVFYIYYITVCASRGLENMYCLTSNQANVGAPSFGVNGWQDYRLEDNNSQSVVLNIGTVYARHVAFLKTDNTDLILQEVEMYGYTESELNEVHIDIQNISSMPWSITLMVNVRGFNPDVFGPVRVQLSREDNSTAVTSETINSSDTSVWRRTDTNLEFSTTYTYHIQVYTGMGEEISQLNKRRRFKTPACTSPEQIRHVQFVNQRLYDDGHGGKLVYGILDFMHPPPSGCHLNDFPLSYQLNINNVRLRYIQPDSSLLIDNLKPYTNFTVNIIATNRDNLATASGPFHLMTRQAAPSGPPEGVSLYPTNTSCVTLTWTQAPSQPNGEITGYNVECTGFGNISTSPNLPGTWVQCGYSPAENVSCQVAAFTNGSDADSIGPPWPLNTTTFRVNPVLSAAALNSSCIKLVYDNIPPVFGEEGISSGIYQINCSHEDKGETITKVILQSVSLPAKYIWCDLPANTRVMCTIASYIKGLEINGQEVRAETVTHFAVDVIENAYNPIQTTPGVFDVFVPTINIDLSQGQIENYFVVVLDEFQRGRQKRQATSCKQQILESLAEWPTFDPLLTFTDAQDCGLHYYIAAVLGYVEPGSPFPIGDGSVSGEINGEKVFNAPLIPGSRYTVYFGINATVKGKGYKIQQVVKKGKSTFTVPLSLRQVDTTPDGMTSGISQGQIITIAVSVCVACVVVVAVVLASILLVKRRRRKKSTSSPDEYISASERTRPPAVSIRPRNTLSEHSERPESGRPRPKYRNITGDYENCLDPGSPDFEESEAIPVAQLKWYIDTNQELISGQYEKLQAVPVGSTSAAMLPENRAKCRYKDLYPADEHRVRLVRPPSEGTDFINASFIAGYNQEDRYIAAQGPTATIVEDFWLMVWQHNVHSIVMATRVHEANKMKCLQYWPDTEGGSMTYGQFKIDHINVETWPDFAITQLQLRKDEEVRWMTHYQFLSWPDHDVPDTTQPFLTLYRKITRQAHSKPGPLLIHCSAGVGRTGAIIALDYLLAQAKEEGQVDIYKCIVMMRERRPFMVQTANQYRFVHNILYDALATENFLTLTDMFPKKMADNEALMQEYEFVESVLSKVETITDSGNAEENRRLNRSQSILPDDKYRIYLNSMDGQTYINAVRVNGYRKLDQFYATQLPLQHTVKDFWQLVHERSCKVIVQLGTTQENVPFYCNDPNTGYAYGDGVHTVTTKSVTQKGILQIFQLEHAIRKRNILKEPRHYTESTEVSLVKLPRDQCDHKSRTMSMHMISIAEQIVKLSQRVGDFNVLVTSKDGAELCGLFICSFNCLESIRLTQEVEVHSQVLMAKRRRRQFINTPNSYRHIYEILGAYVEQFSNYENVSSF